jgi:hypothetical protein
MAIRAIDRDIKRALSFFHGEQLRSTRFAKASRKRGFFVGADRLSAKSKAAQIKALARRHTGAAIRVLAKIMNTEDGPATARVSAAQALLDRGWGKAAQPVAGEEGGPVIIARIERVIVDPSQKNSDQTKTNSSGETDRTHS